jgi:polyhydroxybutyrate depolymerase
MDAITPRASRWPRRFRGVALALSVLLVAGLFAGCSRRNASSTGTTASGTSSGGPPGTTPRPSAGSAPVGDSGGGSGAAAPGTAAPTTTVHPAVPPAATTIDVAMITPDGRERTFHLYVPTSVRPGPGGAKVPLLVALHGGVGWGTQFEKNSGFDGVAEANSFIVVYPDGIGAAGTDAVRTWNGGVCCGPAAKENVDDVAFLAAMIDGLEGQYPIDTHRIYAAGHSNGGIMAYRLACELADKIVAIGVQSSSLELGPCNPAQPVSVLHIHGTADRNVPITGGEGDRAISGVAFNPPVDGIKTIARADGCPAQPTEATVPENADLTIDTWAPCADTAEVRFVRVAGASHAWMGAAAGGSRLVGETYMNYDSSLAIWTFLAAHPRP